MFVLGLVLPEGTVPLQQFVDHAAEAEPVSATVVAHALTKDLRRHVAVRADTRVWLLFAVRG